MLSKKSKNLSLIIVFLLSSFQLLADSPYIREIDSSVCGDDKLIIVSWNICNFGKSKSDDELNFTKEVIKKADLVVLQEISTSKFGVQTMTKLLNLLNQDKTDWDYLVSPPTKEGTSKEKFAVLWKIKKIKITPKKLIILSELSNDLEREGAKITFKFKNNQISLYTFHLVPEDKNPKNEIISISKRLKFKEDEKIIITGDFNLGYEEMNDIMEAKLKLKHRIEGKTSLKNKLEKNGEYLSKEYDNFYTKGIMFCYGAIIDFVPLFKNLKEAKKISDHLPIMMIIKFDK